jgi:hypothetical protein
MKSISNQKEFFSYIQQISASTKTMIFRGVKKHHCQLIPSIGRLKTNKIGEITPNDEELILKLFKQKAYGFIKDHISNNLELLSIAQHHGIPTRLLDWTKNPLVAVYFAVCNGFEE